MSAVARVTTHGAVVLASRGCFALPMPQYWAVCERLTALECGRLGVGKQLRLIRQPAASLAVQPLTAWSSGTTHATIRTFCYAPRKRRRLTRSAGSCLSLLHAAFTSESGEDMTVQVLHLDLDQRTTGQVLESLAERLLRLEKLRADEVDEDTFADAKNDALVLRPLYEELRRRAVQTFGKGILEISDAISQLDDLYR